ncbi:membrane protein [Microbacterium mangrovi]|uniref:Membrane protein n=1 Tax=Microbacterium mangrovi TaxID=1348253 RepID=A0A0B2A4L0_9MICO|nr:membrane protein [Microbacterium mangrovi]KHK98419.1 membrane protein [Microbacterium mangrovi]
MTEVRALAPTLDGSRNARRRRLPAWAWIGVWYLLARGVTTLFFAGASLLSGPQSRLGDHPGVLRYLLAWDAVWYRRVAEHGYPATLPLTPHGEVAANTWAFMPLYPTLAKYLGMPLGAWGAGALVISLVAGYLTALVLHRIWLMKMDESAAMWAVVFFVSGPLAALFQIGYAESLGELFLVLILWGVLARRYAWLYLFIPLLAATRPLALPIALFLGLYGIWRVWRRRVEPLPAWELVNVCLLAVWAFIAGMAWQVIAGVVTGSSSAYVDTETAWRANWTHDIRASFAPFDGFVQGILLGVAHLHLPAVLGYVGLAVGVLAVGALLLFEPHVRRLGVELRLWSASYVLYLLAVFFPQSSLFRLLFPLSPLWGAAAVPRSRVWRIGVLVACLVLQALWIYDMYALGNTKWRVP